MNSGEKIIYKYLNGERWFNKKDKLMLTKQDVIMDYNAPLGYFEAIEINDRYIHFLVLTLQNFKSNKNWQRYKKQLIKAASYSLINVIFVNQIDIFEDDVYNTNDSLSLRVLDKVIIDIMKLTDARNGAIICGSNMLRFNTYYSYCQNDYSAIELLLYFISDKNLNNLQIISLIEPNEEELLLLIDNKVNSIKFYKTLSQYSNEQIQIVNDILNKDIKVNNSPIRYNKMFLTLSSSKYLDKRGI